LYNFDSSPLEFGQHFTKSKSSLENLISSFSKVLGFKVGTKTTAAEPSPSREKEGDLNNDKKVNLVDFSIAAYWYKRPNPPKTVDLNGDNRIDLIDFSIMAYYWTG